jgi:hypothetical protein
MQKCKSKRKDGQPCRADALEGTDYCWNHRKCKGKRKDGQPCRANPLEGKDYCWYQDPEIQKEWKA